MILIVNLDKSLVMNTIVCPKCGLSNTQVDDKRGTLSCLSCGGLSALGNLRADVEFEELNTGRHVAVGSRLRENQRGISSGLRDHFASNQPSSEVTLYNAKKVIEKVARQLDLDREIEVAYNFYKLALQHSITRGHKVKYMAASCLYIATRLRGTHQMLLDFCDVVDANVTILAKCYMKILMALCMTLPPVDPSIYIPRFVHKLKLDNLDKMNVTQTALRICQRMKRDYMSTGRRPSGLCGAAILLAARVHGLNIAFNSIARVVKISETVVRTRLREFEETHAAAMSINELLNVEDGSEGDKAIKECDPPAFTRSREIDCLLKEKLSDINQPEYFEKHLAKIEREIEDAVKTLEIKARTRVLKEEVIQKFKDDFKGYDSDDPEMDEIKEILDPSELNLVEGRDEKVKFEEDDELSGLDDDDIDKYILKKNEAKQKAKVWLKTNASWLKQQRLKRLAEEEDEAAQVLDPLYKPKRKNARKNKSDQRRRSIVKAKLAFLEELDINLNEFKEEETKQTAETIEVAEPSKNEPTNEDSVEIGSIHEESGELGTIEEVNVNPADDVDEEDEEYNPFHFL
ncbi:hypothetical protein ACOME3_001149 [Neoechinorhynchus agilis]